MVELGIGVITFYINVIHSPTEDIFYIIYGKRKERGKKVSQLCSLSTLKTVRSSYSEDGCILEVFKQPFSKSFVLLLFYKLTLETLEVGTSNIKVETTE